ncbi:hypothetical protein KIN20_000341 [Parelaphostrongylus tenuis]|uniref:Uncharacterized protein n=1 Tax=Parelaphostrongylus tenuis TaxID=148309 RepID=A0AAD5LUL3_PARTN|nr:hypothetical protein KIN20_000341 [Parelaphostrongylus tenuis]
MLRSKGSIDLYEQYMLDVQKSIEEQTNIYGDQKNDDLKRTISLLQNADFIQANSDYILNLSYKFLLDVMQCNNFVEVI